MSQTSFEKKLAAEGKVSGTMSAESLLNAGVVLVTRDEEGNPSLEVTGAGRLPDAAFGPPQLTMDEVSSWLGSDGSSASSLTEPATAFVEMLVSTFNEAAADAFWFTLEHTEG